jgi:hypothetical protein
MSFDASLIASQIPYYLAQEEKVALAQALRDWPRPIQYYINRYQDEVLQGDAWTALPIRNFQTGELAYVDGIVLSNSCQIDPENSRALPTKVTIAPLISLGKYVVALRNVGLDSIQIDAKVTAIKEQRIHNIFYFPADGGIEDERIALLDDVYSFPTQCINPHDGGANRKLATLSTVGFYLFVLKLSVHFCRLHENVERRDAIS